MNENLAASVAGGFRALFTKYAEVLKGAVTSKAALNDLEKKFIVSKMFSLFLEITAQCLALRQFLGSWKFKVISF